VLLWVTRAFFPWDSRYVVCTTKQQYGLACAFCHKQLFLGRIK